MSVNDLLYYGQLGSLFPYDVRHSHADRAYCDPRPDGRLNLRLVTEPGFSEAVVVYHNTTWRAQAMVPGAQTRRFQSWQATLKPDPSELLYSFALKREDGVIVYLGAAALPRP